MSDQPPTDPSSPAFVPVCAIGASAGGVSALQTLFRMLPDDLGLAYVVVVHLSPDHPSAMHEILGACTKMSVFQVTDGPTLRANCVYVIAPDSELVIEGDDVKSRPFTDPRSRRAPIDMFFRSIAAGRGDGIAVVLTGAGSDGALGVRAIKEAGGIVMVQEPAEAGFPSMPQNAIATGVADIVAPLARLAERIVEAAHSKEAVRSLDDDGVASDIRRIVAFLRTRTGHDFSGYKRSTVLRRIQRRLQVCQIASTTAYLEYLRLNPEESKELLSDLLISVTMFFRDPETFITLSHRVIQPLLESRNAGEMTDELRAWVVGCATGEEAYSLAILLLEESEQMKLSIPIQIFASDLDEGALATAREGRYPRSIEADVSAERLKRFFIDEGTHYRISRQVRDLILFATHSVVREPPFMRLDLITCRNVLIYLERELQHHVNTIFRYGLKSGGYLFLGTAETVDTSENHFSVVDRDARIYQALPTRPDFVPSLTAPGSWMARRPALTETKLATARLNAGEVLGESHSAALEATAPPSALVDAEQGVLHLSPTVGRFILLSAGPLSGRLPSIVRPELRLDLKLALDRAFEMQQPTITRPIEVLMEGATRRLSLHVRPLPSEKGAAWRAIVYFLDSGPGRVEGAEMPAPPADELQHLHSELKAAQEAELAGRIRSESAVQELRASNEELQSLNEEYRSTAEELETSKEELQSMNEELQTVNAELKSKLGIISGAHDDLQNLTASSEIGTLFLDLDLHIRMFTPPVADLINIADADVGRSITNFTHQLEYDEIVADTRRVLLDRKPLETEIRTIDGRWYTVRIRPYQTLDGRVEGAVVTFDDITEQREAANKLRASEERYQALFAASPVPFMVLTPNAPDFTITAANNAYFAATKTTSETLVGRKLFDAFSDDPRRPGQLGSEALAISLDKVLATRRTDRMERVRYDLLTPGGFEPHWWEATNAPILDASGHISTILHQVNRVTEQHFQEEVERQDLEQRAFLLKLSDALRPSADADIVAVIACRLLAEYLDGSRAQYSVGQDWDGDTTVVTLGEHVRRGEKMTQRSVFAEYGEVMLTELRAGLTVVMRDVDTDPRIVLDVRTNCLLAGTRAAISVPLLKDGRVAAALTIQDDEPRDWTERDIAIVQAVAERTWVAIERAHAESALRESEGRFAQFAASSSDGLWVRDASTLAMEYASPAIRTIYGIDPDAIMGDIERWVKLIVVEHRDIAREHLEEARAGTAVVHVFRILRASDGKARWIRNTDFPLRDQHGRVQRIGGLAEDITEAKEATERQRVLTAELQHRTRNLISVVRSLADKTVARSADLADFQARFSNRMAALARVQVLLSRLDEWDRVTFDELIRSEMSAINGEADRVVLTGPEGVALRSSTVQTFALAIHELATNALKYGALAQPCGRLDIRWRVERTEQDGQPWLHVDWRESGVAMPVVGALPRGGGAGRELIEQALPYQLGAMTTFVLGRDGVHCTIALPVSDRQAAREMDHV